MRERKRAFSSLEEYRDYKSQSKHKKAVISAVLISIAVVLAVGIIVSL